MFRNPSVLELLVVAAIGARGWFVSILLAGVALLGLGLVLNDEVEPKAVGFAFFMPLLLLAVMGTIALGTERARSESWGAGSMRRRAFLAAFIWNSILGVVALAVDQVVMHFKLLPREPFEFPLSLAVVAAMAAGLALMAVFPRQGPQ